MKRISILFALILLFCTSITRAESVASGVPASYALVIGSNRPGAGQDTLQFSTKDADRFKDVLVALGGFREDHVILLQNPSKDSIEQQLQIIEKNLESHQKRHEEALFTFYYSGHARSKTLTLGDEEYSLITLREALSKLPAKLKLVILDACQTGAISNVKGVVPTSDFSHNFVSGLNTAGMAIMASSSASELSQESLRLEGSFFTHHLVVGLRGAADENRDGRVTLSEVYQYAYNNTLTDTAKTAVGKQHVTLETELQGKGEMVLTQPSTSRTWLVLPAALDGEVLVYRAQDNTVLAEVHKVSGDSLRLAVPPADYVALVRTGNKAVSCPISEGNVDEMVLSRTDCTPISLEALTNKGKAKPRRDERVGLEIALGALWQQTDAYNNRLEEFYYETDDGSLLQSSEAAFNFSLAAMVSLLRFFQLGVGFSSLDHGNYRWPSYPNNTAGEKLFTWRAYRVSLIVRGKWPLFNGWLVPYVQVGGGVGFAKSVLENNLEFDNSKHEETDWGYHISAGGGLQFMAWRYVGFFAQAEYIYAPIMENRIDDGHDNGGVLVVTGIRGGY